MLTVGADRPHGFFDPDLAPVATVDAGQTVRFVTLESGWSPEPFDVTDPAGRRRHPAWTERAGHALTGPVAVRGAKAGQVLQIRIEAVEPGGWGTTYANARRTAYNERYGLTASAVHRWTLDPVAGTGRNQHGHTVALRPFPGVIGMPPAEPGRHSTIPPRPHGGNLDCRELVAGSTLWLPIPVDGALLSVGDGHAAQGDGEVSGTAIECPMERVDLTLSTVDDFPVTGPVARTPAGWVTMGLGDTVDDAVFGALNAMFDLLGRLYGVSRPDAVALASVAVDLRVTQIVNQVVGAHAVPAGALRRPTRPSGGAGGAEPSAGSVIRRGSTDTTPVSADPSALPCAHPRGARPGTPTPPASTDGRARRRALLDPDQ